MDESKFKSIKGNTIGDENYLDLYSHNFKLYGSLPYPQQHLKNVYVTIITLDYTKTINQDVFFKLPPEKRSGYMVKYILKLCNVYKIPNPVIDNFTNNRKAYSYYKDKKINNTTAKEFKTEIVGLFDSKNFDGIEDEYYRHLNFNEIKTNYKQSYELLLRTLLWTMSKSNNRKLKIEKIFEI